ncbi:MAG TPA: tetratricopeptide repeat protein, partial [Roseateles sp.]|nr:tetratricopeptide repeat protein [Roseateles sp.]
FMAGYNTLGVIYRRAGRDELAEQVFRAVMAQEPANAQTLSNLILVLRSRGQDAEVERLSARLRDIQPDPPFKFFDLGVAAMKRGEYREAKRLFTREIERSAYFHEFHFWLALANYGLGDLAEVRKHLALARDNSTTTKDRAMYAAKLDSLRGVRLTVDKRPG